MAVINSNVKDIERTARKLGVGEMYGLFACMTSGRSWNAIQSGIDKLKKSDAEENEIKNDASKYLASIRLFRTSPMKITIFNNSMLSIVL